MKLVNDFSDKIEDKFRETQQVCRVFLFFFLFNPANLLKRGFLGAVIKNAKC